MIEDGASRAARRGRDGVIGARRVLSMASIWALDEDRSTREGEISRRGSGLFGCRSGRIAGSVPDGTPGPSIYCAVIVNASIANARQDGITSCCAMRHDHPSWTIGEYLRASRTRGRGRQYKPKQ